MYFQFVNAHIMKVNGDSGCQLTNISLSIFLLFLKRLTDVWPKNAVDVNIIPVMLF